MKPTTEKIKTIIIGFIKAVALMGLIIIISIIINYIILCVK